ncbi:MAG: hypothetical protein J6K38_01275 [Alistipes sp.]|nr:hypothetical protein [Alistipes sp.]
MKRNLFHIFAVAAAAVAFAACSADSDIDSPRPDEGYTITLRTDGIIGDTRTEFDPAINQIKWSASDKAVFYSNGIGRISEITLVDGGKYADFKLSGMRPDMQEDRTRTIQGFYPVEARWHDGHQRDENNQITAFALNLKSRQEAPSTTFDPQADILVAENLQIELADDETEKTIENVRFGRPVAITEIKYVITNDALKASGEQVRSITLHVDSQNTIKYLAGNFYFNPETFRYVDATGAEVDLNAANYFVSDRASSVQVLLSDTPAVNADFTAWVVTAPIALTEGDSLEFIIRTTTGTVITKTVNVQNTVAFSNTRRNTLKVNIDNTATVTTGSAGAIIDGYYVIATDNNMMTTDVVSDALGYTTLPTKYVDGKLSVSEDKAIWYIEQAADGTYTVSSKLNNRFINCTAANTCLLKDTATPLKIQPADAAGKYNISVNSTSGRILGYNTTYPRFAFYDNNDQMVNDLQIIPVHIDNTPSFTLLKNEVTVSATGANKVTDVYQLRNASESNILIDVDGTVVTSATIGNAAIEFNVGSLTDGNGSITLDFDGDPYTITVIPNPTQTSEYVWTLPWNSTSNATARSDDNSLGATLGIYKKDGTLNGGSWSNLNNKSYFNCSANYGFRCVIPNVTISANQNITVNAKVFGWKSGAYVARTFDIVYWTSANSTKKTVKTISSTTASAASIDETFTLEEAYEIANGTLYVEITPKAAGNSGLEDTLSITIAN